MTRSKPTIVPEQPLPENGELRSGMPEAEKKPDAIRNGDVDALVLSLEEANRQLSDELGKLENSRKKLVSSSKKYRLLYNKMLRGEAKYKELVQHARSIILRQDISGKVTFFNEYAQEIFGFKEDEVIGKSPVGTIVPEIESSGRRLDQMLEKIYENPDRYGVNINENIKKNGERIWVEWHNNATFDDEGKSTGHIAIGVDITDRLRIEKSLKESEDKFRKIVETAAEGILTANPEGVVVYLNYKMAEMLGYSVDEVLGRPILDFIDNDLQEQALRIRKAARSRNLHGEFKFRRKDGSELWTSYNVSALLDSNGIYAGNLAMHTDITERKKSEDELYHSEERFRTAFEGGSIPMQLTSLNGDFLRVNHAFCTLLGYTEQELTGMNFRKLTHPDDLEANMDGLKKLENGEISSFRMEKRYIRKNGQIIWVDMSTAPVRNKNGKLDYLVTHVQDINERKEAEKELVNSREKLEIALDSGHIGIWERNLKNDEVIWDERMEQIFNLETGTFGRDYASFENLIDEEDLPHFRNSIDNSLETGSLLETIFRTRSGTGNSKYISTKALVKKDENGTPVSLTGVCFDVTAMKKGAEKAIVRLNEELLRSNKELESFAYVASHDLQEPLRMVSSFTQMLEQKYGDKLDQDAQDYIRFAVDGAKRMYDLINGLLAYSRVQTKGKEFVEVNMEDVFEKVIRNLDLRIKEKNVVITKNDLPVIRADESQMMQLVQNLVENGIKFSPANPRIYFSANADTGCHVFSVKDEGMGIDPQYFERIFKIFQRLMPKEEYEGTGIGLAICKRIVERHKGKIWVESEPDKGSTFFFTIPG